MSLGSYDITEGPGALTWVDCQAEAIQLHDRDDEIETRPCPAYFVSCQTDRIVAARASRSSSLMPLPNGLVR
jgi:hypothetical protein